MFDSRKPSCPFSQLHSFFIELACLKARHSLRGRILNRIRTGYISIQPTNLFLIRSGRGCSRYEVFNGRWTETIYVLVKNLPLKQSVATPLCSKMFLRNHLLFSTSQKHVKTEMVAAFVFLYNCYWNMSSLVAVLDMWSVSKIITWKWVDMVPFRKHLQKWNKQEHSRTCRLLLLINPISRPST